MTTDDASCNDVVIERFFEASGERIWALWTEPAAFAAWYGPTGAEITVKNLDSHVGGRRLVGMTMQTPNGPMTMWFTGHVLEAIPNRRLVYTESMCDDTGDILSPASMGMPTDHPTTTEVVVDLEDLGGRTRMVLTHRGVPADSPGASGWTMAFDKLTDYVAATA